jgi:YYY domain-containing protein
VADAFFWWLTLFLLGLCTLPITLVLFHRLPDRGYAFSRPLSLLIFAYAYWILGHVVPNRRGLTFDIAFAMLAVIVFIAPRRRRVVIDFFKRQWGIVLATEAVFLGVFIVWAIIRSMTPDIAHTEQPMDFMFMNSVLESNRFPPQDAWFAGEPISYYYFGYLMAAGVTKLTGISSSVAYNLALASFAAMAAAGAFSVAYNVVRSMRPPKVKLPSARAAMLTGCLAVILLLFMANMVGFLEYLQANGIGSEGFYKWVRIDGLTGADPSASRFPDGTWWWWRSTRVINSFPGGGGGVDYTITEFPFFSFMLGDMHPHVMALPFMFLAIGIGFTVFRAAPITDLSWLRRHPWHAVLIALVLGGLGFLNSWDLPTFAALVFACILLRTLHARFRGAFVEWAQVAGVILILAVAAIVLYIPFYLVFDSQAQGILPVRRVMTRPVHFTLVWGPFLLLITTFAAGLFVAAFRQRIVHALRWLWGAEAKLSPDAAGAAQGGARPRFWRQTWFWAVALPLVPFAVWAGVELGIDVYEGKTTEGLMAIGTRFWHLMPWFIVMGIALAVLIHKARREGGASAPVQFTLVLILLGLLLTMGAELFRIVDFFNNRMNTVFKFYYQTWAVFSVAGAVALWWWASRLFAPRRLPRVAIAGLLVTFAAAIIAGMAYMPPAVKNKAVQGMPSRTLDALASAKRNAPKEMEAIAYLQSIVDHDMVVVEAMPGRDGRPTGDYDAAISRISMRTGIPTILGWPGHEHQWRGDPFDPILERFRDVDTIYRSPDAGLTAGLLQKYEAEYVFIGDLERRTYGPNVGQKFAGFMDIEYKNDSVVIYRTRDAS